MSDKKIKITQIKSAIGYRQRTKDTLLALGIKKMNSSGVSKRYNLSGNKDEQYCVRSINSDDKEDSPCEWKIYECVSICSKFNPPKKDNKKPLNYYKEKCQRHKWYPKKIHSVTFPNYNNQNDPLHL